MKEITLLFVSPLSAHGNLPNLGLMTVNKRAQEVPSNSHAGSNAPHLQGRVSFFVYTTPGYSKHTTIGTLWNGTDPRNCRSLRNSAAAITLWTLACSKLTYSENTCRHPSPANAPPSQGRNVDRSRPSASCTSKER